MKREHVKAVFFDLDHTLWDFERNSALAFQTVFSTYNINVLLDDFLKVYIPVNLRYWKLFRDEKITRQQLRYGRFRETFDTLKYNISDEVIGLVGQEYVDRLPDYNHLYDGALEILDYLKPRYSLHIITNGFKEIQASKIKNANIAHYFTTVTNSDIAGCKKPNPLIYEFALKAANADKSTSIMIGDCIEADVQGALDFGLDAIYFNEARNTVPGHISQVYHLTELKNFL
ncbi:noncanonical pyrimidine nucleotidase, YjjG family [Flavobacterium cyanobacteriorum]|uniref:Noncanonical pyrimidine nucleotidase, YjjG family n=1 Tax=Flavobacterium cyanobacteriorum TaxID=2022802 RepID=A0A255Z4G3_9FLAO|nr:YjjG family noncanonical pyrimidine nucleotidase [Flavobacterium cyanobacteriorum]OYQ36339.1 noncanonical pyrimidine nucleotidase, YjjG family [Flavobacterium cyanobacteriorum]